MNTASDGTIERPKMRSISSAWMASSANTLRLTRALGSSTSASQSGSLLRISMVGLPGVRGYVQPCGAPIGITGTSRCEAWSLSRYSL
jgi:hypothetical protein